jgi:hypothetical protein
MSNFNRYFVGSLMTEAESGRGTAEPPSDADAFNAALDKDTPPDQFDTQPLEGGGTADYVETAKHWITKLQTFANEINGLEENSLNTQINELDREGSPFAGIEKELSGDIVGVAETLAGMAELIKGHVIGVDKRRREQVQQTAGVGRPSGS